VILGAIGNLRALYPIRWLAIWDCANDTLIHGYREGIPVEGWRELCREGWGE